MRRRKILLALSAALLLSGCASESLEETMETVQIPVTTTAPSEAAEPAERDLLPLLIQPKDSDFVLVKEYIPEILVELPYAGEDNFTGQAIYFFKEAFLRYGTVVKLKAAAEELAEQGLYLKIWDAFRPVSAQFKLWEICPDPTYVADPNKGFSNHSRGYAVDVTLVDSEGREVEMPTGFDDFSARADRDYAESTQAAAENARLLESVMEKHGFSGYWGEWWHFSDTEQYDVETCFDPAVISLRHTAGDAALLNENGEHILTVPAGETVTLMGWKEEFAMVDYWGYRGYIPAETVLAE